MTVGELIEKLEDFEEDREVAIGMFQRYGSNFVNEIYDVDSYTVDDWEVEERCNEVLIIQGGQIGTIREED